MKKAGIISSLAALSIGATMAVGAPTTTTVRNEVDVKSNPVQITVAKTENTTINAQKTAPSATYDTKTVRGSRVYYENKDAYWIKDNATTIDRYFVILKPVASTTP